MTTYRYTGELPTDLADGRQVEPYTTVDLDSAAAEAAHNADLIERGLLVAEDAPTDADSQQPRRRGRNTNKETT